MNDSKIGRNGSKIWNLIGNGENVIENKCFDYKLN